MMFVGATHHKNVLIKILSKDSGTGLQNFRITERESKNYQSFAGYSIKRMCKTIDLQLEALLHS
jgi:hypothetical protein